MPMMKLPRVSGCLQFLCTPRTKWRDVSGGLHAHDEIAESLRLSALFGHATPENGGPSHAVCMPMLKIAESLRLYALFGHATPENGGASHAVCMPVMKLPTVSGSGHDVFPNLFPKRRRNAGEFRRVLANSISETPAKRRRNAGETPANAGELRRTPANSGELYFRNPANSGELWRTLHSRYFRYSRKRLFSRRTKVVRVGACQSMQ